MRVERDIKATRKVKVSAHAAKTIVSAMSLSYNLGAKTIQQVLERFEREKQTQWGVGMALSYIAAHGTFRKGIEGTHQTLSTIAGAVLLIDDIPKAEEKSLEWLKSHVLKGRTKSVDELLKDVTGKV